jgi:phosphohistidine swiveling domain-containing protein
MNPSLEVCNTFSKEHTPGLEEEKVEKIFPDAYTAATFDGRTASAGRAVGWAVVVKNEKDLQRVREGAVIVASTASRELIANIQKACAVVTEAGGIGATAFWYAREYDIPAVTGVEGLIEVVSEGDLLQVDGTNGTVEILRRKASRLRR